MPPSPCVRAAIAAALAAACNADPVPGREPEDLEDVCQALTVLAHVTPDEPVDYLAFRDRNGRFTSPWGIPCETAAAPTACLTALQDARPAPGWSSAGIGLAWTRGDDVGIADDAAEVAEFLAPVDAPADALVITRAEGYHPDCPTVREQRDGAWQLLASTSSCGGSQRRVEVDTDGAFTELEVVSESSGCVIAGRRPDGLAPPTVLGDAVARELAALAHLEAASIVAFERLADELAHHGAPPELVARARAAARDEARHAELMGAVAEASGVAVPPVHVRPPPIRTLFELARENAVEGCVRETYGAADAAFRGAHAPTAPLRELFASIANDEAEHAALAWDIHAWVADHLDADALDALDAVRDAAWTELTTSVDRSPGEVALGAPDSVEARAMLHTLRARLAA